MITQTKDQHDSEGSIHCFQLLTLKNLLSIQTVFIWVGTLKAFQIWSRGGCSWLKHTEWMFWKTHTLSMFADTGVCFSVCAAADGWLVGRCPACSPSLRLVVMNDCRDQTCHAADAALTASAWSCLISADTNSLRSTSFPLSGVTSGRAANTTEQ